MSSSGRKDEILEAKQTQDPGYLVIDALLAYDTISLVLGNDNQAFSAKSENSQCTIQLKANILDVQFQAYFCKALPLLKTIESKDPIPASYLTLITEQARKDQCGKLTTLDLANLEPSDGELLLFLQALAAGHFPRLTLFHFDGWKLSPEALCRLAKLNSPDIKLTNKIYGFSVIHSSDYKGYFSGSNDNTLVLSLKDEALMLVTKKGNTHVFYNVEPDCISLGGGNRMAEVERYQSFARRFREKKGLAIVDNDLIQEGYEILKEVALKYGYTIFPYNGPPYMTISSKHITYLKNRRDIEACINEVSLFTPYYDDSFLNSLIPEDLLRFKENIHARKNEISTIIFNPYYCKPCLDFFMFLLTSPEIRAFTLDIGDLIEEKQEEDHLSYVSKLLEILAANKTIRHLVIRKELTDSEKAALEGLLLKMIEYSIYPYIFQIWREKINCLFFKMPGI